MKLITQELKNYSAHQNYVILIFKFTGARNKHKIRILRFFKSCNNSYRSVKFSGSGCYVVCMRGYFATFSTPTPRAWRTTTGNPILNVLVDHDHGIVMVVYFEN